MQVEGPQSCSTLGDPTDYTVHGLLQAGLLEWVAFPSPGDSFQPRNWTHVSNIAGRFFTSWSPREAQMLNPDTGQDWRQEEKGKTEDEMVGWHHWLDGHEFEQAPGVGDGQGSLACCSPWGHRARHDWGTELNWVTEQQNSKSFMYLFTADFEPMSSEWLTSVLHFGAHKAHSHMCPPISVTQNHTHLLTRKEARSARAPAYLRTGSHAAPPSCFAPNALCDSVHEEPPALSSPLKSAFSAPTCPLPDSSVDAAGAEWTPVPPTPNTVSPLLLTGHTSWHVFPIRPVLSCRETGNRSQPQTHPDAGNRAETAAAPAAASAPGHGTRQEPARHCPALPLEPRANGGSRDGRKRTHPTMLQLWRLEQTSSLQQRFLQLSWGPSLKGPGWRQGSRDEVCKSQPDAWHEVRAPSGQEWAISWPKPSPGFLAAEPGGPGLVRILQIGTQSQGLHKLQWRSMRFRIRGLEFQISALPAAAFGLTAVTILSLPSYLDSQRYGFSSVHVLNMRVEPCRRWSTGGLMHSNDGAGNDSWESLGLQGDQTSPS